MNQPRYDECIRAIRTQLKIALDNLQALEACVKDIVAKPEPVSSELTPPVPPGPELPMTKKQAEYIRHLGVEPRPDLTRREASELIERLKGVK
jgi:hypothetical protein